VTQLPLAQIRCLVVFTFPHCVGLSSGNSEIQIQTTTEIQPEISALPVPPRQLRNYENTDCILSVGSSGCEGEDRIPTLISWGQESEDVNFKPRIAAQI